jgi:hypothetical protein
MSNGKWKGNITGMFKVGGVKKAVARSGDYATHTYAFKSNLVVDSDGRGYTNEELRLECHMM